MIFRGNNKEAQDRSDPKTEAIVEPLLGAAARYGELGVAIARLTTGAAVSIFWPILHWDNLLALVPRTVAVLLGGWVAVAWSVYVLRRLAMGFPSSRLMLASITVDAFAINALLLSFVWYPAASHDSIVEVHGSAMVYLAIVMAGARLSVPAAIWGAVVNSVLLGALITLSTIRVDNWTTIGPVEWISVAAALVGSTVLGVTIAQRTGDLVYRAASKSREAEKAVGKLGAYVSDEIARELLKQEELQLGGSRQHVAVLFSDLRGFTEYSESLAPEELVRQLNEYLNAMVTEIAACGGVVDKYIGDAIMAVFGIPFSKDDDVNRALRAAKGMRRALRELNQQRQSAGLKPLEQGIGIHFGPVVAGNVGTLARAEYTVIGDTVNLASRLESATKNFPCDVLVSQQVQERCGESIELQYLDEITVKGRSARVRVYSLD
ncbi:MAG: adenylate/guanylate cyclase domain-containing protein [Pirellulaceae bacterium]